MPGVSRRHHIFVELLSCGWVQTFYPICLRIKSQDLVKIYVVWTCLTSLKNSAVEDTGTGFSIGRFHRSWVARKWFIQLKDMLLQSTLFELNALVLQTLTRNVNRRRLNGSMADLRERAPKPANHCWPPKPAYYCWMWIVFPIVFVLIETKKDEMSIIYLFG